MLKPLVFETLLALTDEPQHGWALVRALQQRAAGQRILPGNFYRTLRRMLSDGLIEVVPGRSRSTDERRRYFRLTPRGQHVVREEARRLQALVQDSRTRKLLPRDDARGAATARFTTVPAAPPAVPVKCA